MITLSEAAHKGRLSYIQAYRLLLTGEWSGERRGNKWMVDPGSVESWAIRKGHRAPRPVGAS